ncbi:TetR/AcrR family transcriptional regulator [Burkholderia gladioli]|uniref:TetR/AcrR family transcriptional regulator n=1 Tax=Burkholderia gladioli TaxID=28095 RepID=UPI00163EF469|nr:TetR/AcrR family transcriptional regulator [Burkholderia gladioli]MBU9379926.1 TetR/AcrR family transcriptional regulator [Burkholderia gladioli]
MNPIRPSAPGTPPDSRAAAPASSSPAPGPASAAASDDAVFAPASASSPAASASAAAACAADPRAAAGDDARGNRRKKAPAHVRAQLLQAAAEIATELGVQAVTLDAVAERAGVSKGGLQYHFRSKQALFDALFGQTLERFEQTMQAHLAGDPHPQGANARAYLHAAMNETSPAASTNLLRVLVSSMMTDPEARERWAQPMREIARPDPLPLEQAARLMICRLAADGLWISELLGYQNLPSGLRDEIVRQLETMTLSGV